MEFLKNVVLTVMLCAAMTIAPQPAAAEDEPHHFVFSITTDESWAAGSALTQAAVADERGHKVTVLLSVRGIHLAEANSAQGGFSVTARSPRDMLARLMEHGHTVLVCGMCMVAGGVEQEDLIPGAQIAGSEMTFSALTAPDTIVLSY